MKNVIWLENFYTYDSLEVYDLVLLAGALSTSYDIEFGHFHVSIPCMYVCKCKADNVSTIIINSAYTHILIIYSFLFVYCFRTSLFILNLVNV